MADEAIDIVGRKLHPREHFGHRGPHMFGNEIGNCPLEDDAKALGIDAPAHDIERIGPQLFARRLDPGRAAVAGAQNDRRRAVAEQAGGDDIGLGQFVVADGERAEFERDQQHVGAGPRLRQPRCDRQPRHAARAAQTEHRNARHVGAQAELAGDARLQRRRRDARRTHRDDGIDIAGREIGTRDAPCARRRRTGIPRLRGKPVSAPASRVARDTIRWV